MRKCMRKSILYIYSFTSYNSKYIILYKEHTMLSNVNKLELKSCVGYQIKWISFVIVINDVHFRSTCMTSD